jgi:hypothetical protein
VTKIVVFGENTNDTNALRELVLGWCPGLSSADVRVVREPPTLNRGAHQRALLSWIDKARRVLAAARIAIGEIICILAHSDSDMYDDGAFEASRTADLRTAGFPQAHAVVPVQAIEAWWLLHPDATESIVPSWRGALSNQSRNVDTINDPKAELIRRTRAKLHKRPYRESDSPDVARAIATMPDAKAKGTSPSLERFRSAVGDCCRRATATRDGSTRD